MHIEQRDHIFHGQFRCMASPCEVLIETEDKTEAERLLEIAEQEAMRIEYKFSRYRDDNIVFEINNSNGKAVAIDEETLRLLEFSDQCYRISEGLFDITSGVLRTLWHFNGSDNIPTQQEIDKVLDYIGWDRVEWDRQLISLPPHMEIDFGGIGKEYAVDLVLGLLQQHSDRSMMVNFGGDCHASAPQSNGQAWITGIEDPDHIGEASGVIMLKHGALATSGDAYRYLEKDGIRYSHIINPKTGWPAINSPRSVTVAAANCIEAGILSTLAMLQGKDAETFLDTQQVKYWCYR